MNDRTEFNKKAEEILSFMDSYGTVRYEHLEIFFPDNGKSVKYLIKNKRLHKSTDGTYVGVDLPPRPDKPLIAALSVLGNVLGKVHAHTKATSPAQISFITHSGEYYEIIYVAHGMEAMAAAAFETQLTARKHSGNYSDTTKRMVIVEDKNQMDRLQIPGTTRFALVLPDGSLTYYKTK